MEIDNITSQMVKEYNQRLEQIIKTKLTQLYYEAIKRNELDLAEITRNIDYNNIEQFKKDLEQNGYTIEIEQHETITTYEKVDDIFKATTKIGDVRLKVKKLIVEL